ATLPRKAPQSSRSPAASSASSSQGRLCELDAPARQHIAAPWTTTFHWSRNLLLAQTLPPRHPALLLLVIRLPRRLLKPPPLPPLLLRPNQPKPRPATHRRPKRSRPRSPPKPRAHPMPTRPSRCPTASRWTKPCWASSRRCSRVPG